MIGATLRLPTIDKMNFRVPPQFCDVSPSALRKCNYRTEGGPNEGERTRYEFNDSGTGVHFKWLECSGLFIDCNPNNIGDPDDIVKAYKSVGVGLPDPYTWLLNRIDIERNQQLSRSADTYFSMIDYSLGPKMRRTDQKTYATTYTTKSAGVEMQFYDKTAERKARGKAIDTNNVMRLEFRFTTVRSIKQTGIQTAGDLYDRGTDYLTTVYKQQFDRFLPGLPSFAGDGSTPVHGSKINRLVGIFEAINNDPDNNGNVAKEFLYTIRGQVPYSDNDIIKAFSIFCDTSGVPRYQKSRDIRFFKSKFSNPDKYGFGQPIQLNTLAKELLSFAS